MKPTISFDLDGVLFAIIPAIIKELKDRFYIAISPEDVTHYSFIPDWLKVNHQGAYEFFQVGLMENPKFFRSLPPLEGSIRTISNLSDHFSIWAITARKQRNSDYCKDRIQEMFPAIGDNVIATHDKLSAAKGIGSLWHVEDSGELALELAEGGINVILLDYPYNREYDHPKIYRVSDLSEVEKVLKQFLHSYEEGNNA